LGQGNKLIILTASAISFTAGHVQAEKSSSNSVLVEISYAPSTGKRVGWDVNSYNNDRKLEKNRKQNTEIHFDLENRTTKPHQLVAIGLLLQSDFVSQNKALHQHLLSSCIGPVGPQSQLAGQGVFSLGGPMEHLLQCHYTA